MSRYVLGADAVLDLEDIWDYIASDSIDAADRWIARLFDAFEEIARMPGIGHRREDLTAYPLLFRTVGAYLIIHRVGEPRSVEIVAVRQGSRDTPRSFDAGCSERPSALARFRERERQHPEGHTMYRIPAFLFAVALIALSAHAQSPGAPKFEVASIKRCQDSDTGGGGGDPTPGRIHLNCLTTANLIRMAYLAFPTGQPNDPVSPTFLMQPISGGPAWMNSDRYRIDAKAEGPENLEMLRGPMMQALLEDRFRLKLHRESKETNVFELIVGKSGLKLHPAKEGGCEVFDRNHPPPEPSPGQPGPVLCGSARMSVNGGFDILGVTIADLCRELTKYVDRDIIDKTEVRGVFDVHLELAPVDLGYPDAAPDPTSTFVPGDGRAIATTLEKLGLQMRPAKGSAPFLVIDHVERPSEN